MPLRRWTEGGLGPPSPFTVNRDSPQAVGLWAWWPTTLLVTPLRLTSVVGGNYAMAPSGTSPTIGPGNGGCYIFTTGGEKSVTASLTPPGFPQTLTCWFYITAGGFPQEIWNLYGSSGSSHRLGLTLNVSNQLVGQASAGGGQASATITSPTIATYTWYFGALVAVSATSRIVYLNAGISGSDTTSRNPTLARVRAGGDSGGSKYLEGGVADLRIYNRALSQADLWHMFTAQTRWDMYLPTLTEGRAVTTQNLTKSAGGSLSLGGGIQDTASRGVSGALSVSGTAQRGGTKTASGTLPTSGALSRTGGRGTAGSLPTTGTLVRTGGRQAGGSLTSAGVLRRSAARSLAGTLAAVGSLRRAIERRTAGTLATEGDPTPILTRTVSGTLTTAGAITKGDGRRATGTLATAGALTRLAARRLTGLLTPVGGLVWGKSLYRSLDGSLTASGAVAKTPLRKVTGSLSSAGTVRRSSARIFSGALATAGTLRRGVARQMTGVLSGAGTMVRGVARKVAGGLTLAGGLYRTFTATASGTLSLAGDALAVIREALSIAPAARTLVLGAEARILSALAEARRFVARLEGRRVRPADEGRDVQIEDEARRLRP